MTLFKPRVGKVIFALTIGGFTVIIPKKLMYGEYVGEVICGFPLYKREDLVYNEPIGDALM